MDFRVEITGPAIADLAEIVSYIAQDNPAAARALGDNLLDSALSLAKTPHKGSRYRNLAGVQEISPHLDRGYLKLVLKRNHARGNRTDQLRPRMAGSAVANSRIGKIS
jgi:plasmid stabilization system protein ParE